MPLKDKIFQSQQDGAQNKKIVSTPLALRSPEQTIELSRNEIEVLEKIDELQSLYAEVNRELDDNSIPITAFINLCNEMRTTVFSHVGLRCVRVTATSTKDSIEIVLIDKAENQDRPCKHTSSLQLETFNGVQYICNDCGVAFNDSVESD
jgi:hypothetical protein